MSGITPSSQSIFSRILVTTLSFKILVAVPVVRLPHNPQVERVRILVPISERRFCMVTLLPFPRAVRIITEETPMMIQSIESPERILFDLMDSKEFRIFSKSMVNIGF